MVDFPWKILLWAVVIFFVFTAIKDYNKLKEAPLEAVKDTGKLMVDKTKDLLDKEDSDPVKDAGNQTLYGRPRCNTDTDCRDFSPTAYCAQDGNCYERY